jgi:hypothetical protein
LGAGSSLRADKAEIRWVQDQASAVFTFLASTEPGQELELRPLDDQAPTFHITKGVGELAYWQGSAAAIGFKALCIVLTHPELQRINRCIVDGCHAPLVERRRASTARLTAAPSTARAGITRNADLDCAVICAMVPDLGSGGDTSKAVARGPISGSTKGEGPSEQANRQSGLQVR